MLTDQASPSLLCGGTDLYKTCIFVASGLNFHSCSKLHISSCCAMWELSGNPSSCALSINLCSSNPRKTLSCNCCCAHPDCNRTDKTWFSDQAFLFVCSLPCLLGLNTGNQQNMNPQFTDMLWTPTQSCQKLRGASCITTCHPSLQPSDVKTLSYQAWPRAGHQLCCLLAFRSLEIVDSVCAIQGDSFWFC